MLKKIISFLPQILALLFLVGFAVFAWQEPTSAPPADNVSAPLNISDTGQSKSGWLTTLKSLFIGSTPSGAEQGTTGVLRTTGGAILNTGNATTGLIISSGNVGIGTASPGAKLDVNGDIKAISLINTGGSVLPSCSAT
ncbi:MAG: hypothetical protein Q7R84_03680, partial [bacterium]|nr:hypothetical protein [bacterium]